jgi:malate dehydrogenase (oxaloacetate-decarboxylating)
MSMLGTNNQNLLDDPLYIGANTRRLKGREYSEFIEEFMYAIYQRWPEVMVQFEDFSTDVALPTLDKYRYKYLCFNDDIQGRYSNF